MIQPLGEATCPTALMNSWPPCHLAPAQAAAEAARREIASLEAQREKLQVDEWMGGAEGGCAGKLLVGVWACGYWVGHVAVAQRGGLRGMACDCCALSALSSTIYPWPHCMHSARSLNPLPAERPLPDRRLPGGAAARQRRECGGQRQNRGRVCSAAKGGLVGCRHGTLVGALGGRHSRVAAAGAGCL